ncbi:hypothetical protein AMS68_002290 [Peltaster fructicola]|uniref:Eisosome protein 1 n=1 Tax=Peltaster fructicola TaxID=286661 RepID=A0A6H0XPY8_9PEZI|nr:hypothetical protein AMS68_002290 [Peltaster fructicola]
MSGEHLTTAPPCPDPRHIKTQQAVGASIDSRSLSSKSAAASLKYARPQDLPSYPTHGIDTANSAGQAAMLAKDYKMKELWQPELSSAGSRAALLAHKDGGKLDLWHPTASADGNSAAKLAMRNKTLSPQLDYGYTKDGRSNALLAATKSQRNGRQRAGSSPAPVPPVYPDSANSAYNALNAATISHRASVKTTSPRDPDGWDSAAMQAARIQNIGDHLDREMYTERPPVEIELQEKRDKDALRASAVSMAKQMYEAQNRTPGSSDGKSVRASGTTDIKQEAMRYIHLQDAAHKLAQERLAKVDKNFETMRYREYYGYNANPQRSRLSMTGFMRKRASSEAAKDDLDSSDDEEQARRVRNQMSQFNTALASVDAKKQQTDRDALLAVAQKRVQKSMLDMDAKVFQDTGKVSQAMMDEWETKAKKRATEDAEKREINRGKTHIGAGKYMDTAEIEAIAQARLKPTLDEINENAERRRARDEEIRQEKEQQERFKQQEKLRSKEGKEEWKRFKEEEKAVARKEKAENDGDNKRSFLSRLSVKRKSRDPAKHEAEGVTGAAAAGSTLGEVAEKVKNEDVTDEEIMPEQSTTQDSTMPVIEQTAVRESVLPTTATEPATIAVDDQADVTTAEDDTHGKSGKGIKGLFSKLRNRKSHAEDELHQPEATSPVVGSAAVADEQHTGAKLEPTPVVASSVTEPPTLPQQTGSDITPAPVGTDETPISPSSFKRREVDDDADISSLSSGVDEDDFKDGRTGRAARALRMKGAEPKTKLEDDPEDDEEETFEEARDTVDPSSAPEPAFVGQKNAVQHGRETKFQEVL